VSFIFVGNENFARKIQFCRRVDMEKSGGNFSRATKFLRKISRERALERSMVLLGLLLFFWLPDTACPLRRTGFLPGESQSQLRSFVACRVGDN
jgi:hypothetical protein